MKKIKVIFFLASLSLVFGWSNYAQAVPNISGLSGDITDEKPVVLYGSGFGQNDLDVEWLGGPSGNIEAGQAGQVFSKSGWSVDQTSSGWQSSEYSSVKAYSGSKSIKSFTSDPGQWGRGYYFDTGGPQDRIYASWWVYLDFEPGASGCQWKIYRISPTSSYSDKNGEIMSSAWYNTDGSHSQSYIIYFCDAMNYEQCYPSSNASLRWLGQNDVPNKGSWQRMEVYVDGSSQANVRDGSIYYAIHKQTALPNVVKNDQGTVITRVNENDKYRYVMFQNYYGNCGEGDRTKVKMYIDDIYIQTGTKARIELGNASTFSASTKREIQIPSSWSDNSITFSVNQGAFTSGQTAYLYVVDENGAVNSSGYPITIGGTSNQDTTPPVRSNGSPSGSLPAGAVQTTMTLATNENATCKFATNAGTAYSSMTNTFSTTGGTNHSVNITGLQNGQSYNRYIRCIDSSGNANTDDFTISWSVANPPALTGDLNSDGVVDIFDYNIFLQNFGAINCGNVADLNGDCKVNIFDYNILLENFGVNN
jgi:hypothetical protein